MFGFFKRRERQSQALPNYTDVYDTMLYQAPDGTPKGALPTIYAFRVKDSRAIFRAASEAQKAVDYIMDRNAQAERMAAE